MRNYYKLFDYNNYMSGDSTSINDLPTDPVGGGSIGGGSIGGGSIGGGSIGGGSQPFPKVELQISEMSNSQSQGSGPPSSSMSLDQQTISQIVNGLQQASVTGATQLPSRDIPQSIENIIHDPQIQPTYIPPEQQKDYINEYDNTTENIIDNYNKNLKYKDSLDELYDEIQIPLLMAVLYFLFQLPIFKKYLYKFFPVLFYKDGNINIYGLLFMSALYGMLYYLLSKMMVYYSAF
jgi:hypothetical protein